MSEGNGPTRENAEANQNPSTHGRTWADVVGELLVQPRMWLPLLGFLALVWVAVIAGVFWVPRLFSAQTTEFTLGGAESHLVIQSVEKNGNGLYVLVVSPQGWQPSGISVRKGDQVRFAAGGKVCIDVNSIIEMVAKRKKYEDEWARRKQIRTNDRTETRVPEDYFTEREQRDLILDRPWVDPNGFSLDVFRPSFRSRRERYLLPEEPAGSLVAAIGEAYREPPKEGAFFVGVGDKVAHRGNEWVAPNDGWLWFTVNDVQYADALNRNLFYNDNIGFYWVRVTVKHP